MVDQGFPDLKLPPGYQLRAYETLESTSVEAKRLAHAGASAGLWVLTDQQTAGKGRQGRVWNSLPGNLFASLLLYPACDISKIPELSFVSAVAVASTLRHFSDTQITCKWPNDIMLEGKKAAGILLEAESSGNPGKPWVVIGIGINIAAKPDGVDYPAACLNDDLENPPTRDQVFEVLAKKMAEALNRWAMDGFGPIRTLWLNQAHNLGAEIKIESAGKTQEGSFEGLSKSGALLLKDLEGNLIEIISGNLMLLAIDVGNSNIVFALMKGEDIVQSWRVETGEEISEETFTGGLSAAGINASDLMGGVLGSVVPTINQSLEQTFQTLTGQTLLVVKGDGTDTGLEMDLDTPGSIGADRALNILAGKHYYGAPLIIIDFGTATTYDAVDEKGVFVGGAIGAGIGISLMALHTETAQLPLIEFDEPPSVIGKNAKNAMQSAAFFGALGAFEGIVERMKAEMAGNVTVLATGGFSGHFEGKTKTIDHFAPDLTLQGLRIVFERINS